MRFKTLRYLLLLVSLINSTYTSADVEVNENYFPVAEYVDLGLPSGVKWATWNIGASSVTDYGKYYQWSDGDGDGVITTSSAPTNIQGTVYDTATQQWGENWQMPTEAQIQELTEKCEWEGIDNYQNSGVNGFLVTGPNGNSIFIPSAGYIPTDKTSVEHLGSVSMYWSSEANAAKAGCYFQFAAYSHSSSYTSATVKMPIRAIYVEKGSTPSDPGETPVHPMGDAPEGTQAVDLGLSVNWSNFNLGATLNTSTGDYYMWGDTKTQTDFSKKNYPYLNADGSLIDISNEISNTDYDAAKARWKGSWRMPTQADWSELINDCNWEWTTINNVEGFKVTSKKNKNYIFLPITGQMSGTNKVNSTEGHYWMSCPDPATTNRQEWALRMVLKLPSGTDTGYSASRLYKYKGCIIRPVMDKGSSTSTYTISIQSSSGGSVSFNSTTISNTTKSFTVSEGRNATITITPNSGYRLKSLTVNGTNVTSSVSNNQYTISSVSGNTTVVATFEQIPVTTYSLSIQSGAGGSVSYDGTTVTNKTQSFTVNEGTSATITITPNSGYQLASLTVNGSNVTSSVTNNQYTISNINANTTVIVSFELKDNPDDPGTGGDTPQTMKVGTAVDLGLSSGILWSDINVGAQTSDDYGNYYAWGETETKDSYSFDNYVYKVDGATDMNVQESYIEIGTDIQGTAYDVAHVKWGGKWRMPTEKEMWELINNCTWTWKDNGFLITGPNGNTIFLPATGYFNGSSVYSDYTQARYWTSDVNVYKDSYHAWARALSFVKSSGEHFMGSYVRSLGCAIRPVYDKTISGSTYYTLSIQSGSGGSVSFNSTTISNTTKSFTVSEGRNATITITPNDNYRLKSLTVNGTNVTSSVSNNQYTISNIQTDITVVTTFEQIPITTYTLSIQSSSGGTVTYNGTTISYSARSFTVNQGTSATITLSPNSGYQLASLTVNGTNVTSSVTNNQYTINNINANTTVVATFEAISPTTYTFSIRSGGNGTISCNGSTTSSSTVTFSIAEGSTATITVSPNTGYRLSSLTVNGINVTSSVTNNRYTINNITANTNVVATFELMTYNLSVQASGNGTVTYNSYSTKNTTRNYTVSHGTSATLTITPDSGYRLTTLTVNGTNVTSNVSNNRYTISSITANTTVVALFEEIPSTTYSLSIKSGSGGSISYNGSTITNTTRSFTVNEGTNATITITPNTGYRLASLTVNGANVTSSISNNQYTINNITTNTTIVATFEEVPPTVYSLSIQSGSGGSVTYNGTTITNSTRSFSVNEKTSVTISISAKTGYKLSTLTVNGSNVTSSVSNNQYTIGSVTGNTTIVATFAENLQSFSAEGINYQMTSAANKTLNVGTGSYSGHVIIPANVTHEGETWSVRGAESGAFNNAAITAITWNPTYAIGSNAFGSQTNPNMLLYVQSASYAPSNIQNVIANGKAKKIVLTDAASGNDFDCPEAFTAEEISYSHKYSMKTGIGESRGWETITLPFDVKEFNHESKGTLIPFKVYSSTTNGKPFWLYQLTTSGWQASSTIEANKPYIISMPNNELYDQDYNLSGTVTFSSNNVTVPRTEVESVKYGDRTFVANYKVQSASWNIYALNVNNEYSSYNEYLPEGSSFIRELRTVHPFEAYMTTSANNAKRVMPVFEELPTAIREIPMTGFNGEKGLRIYTLAGNLVLFSETITLQEALKRLPRGVYIINGTKIAVK